jgi:hypothetical protein
MGASALALTKKLRNQWQRGQPARRLLLGVSLADATSCVAWARCDGERQVPLLFGHHNAVCYEMIQDHAGITRGTAVPFDEALPMC